MRSAIALHVRDDTAWDSNRIERRPDRAGLRHPQTVADAYAIGATGCIEHMDSHLYKDA